MRFSSYLGNRANSFQDSLLHFSFLIRCDGFHNTDTQLSWEQNEEIKLSSKTFPVVVETLREGI